MIGLSVDSAGTLLVQAKLPSGGFAYVDGDWLPGVATDSLPALVADAEGHLRSTGDGEVMAGNGDPDAVAAKALLAVADNAVRAVERRPEGSVIVTGSGLVARLARARLGPDLARDDYPTPTAAIDATGDPDVITSVLGRVSELGTVALAGEAAGRVLDLNLYADVHLRGLRVVGIPAPLAAASFVDEDADARLLEDARAALTRVRPGESLPPRAAWYRVSA
ncbi:MAG: hypothetical protein ACRDOP_00935 [Gaiellaceae bacterium]